jgi:pimeloyl-ACP methyl ester carboxylesterase
MDYADPTGPTIELAVTRVPANGTALGSLLVNPGGPGGSAFDYAKAADFIVTPKIRENYDIVGVDPRGVGKSDPIRCLTDEEIDALIAFDGDLDIPEERRQAEEFVRMPGERCEQEASPQFAFLGSVNAARDLDIVRAVLGDPKLKFIGKSYGSYLGALYAELFPQNVGRIVLDGILSVDQDAEEITREQALGLERSAEAFMKDCLGKSDCPFTGSVADGMQQLRDFFERASRDPIPTSLDRDLNGSLAAYAVLLYLYFPDIDFPILRSALSAAIERNDGTELLSALDERLNRSSDGTYGDNATDAFYAVTCLDQPYAGSIEDTERLSIEWEKESPTFGPGLALGLMTCADWPATDPDRIIEVTAKGSAPILLVSTTGDPVTAHDWGIALDKSLENSALITWDAVNHTAYFEGDACVDRAVDAYLLSGELPDAGLVCR